jgi:hypothetical protein
MLMLKNKNKILSSVFLGSHLLGIRNISSSIVVMKDNKAKIYLNNKNSNSIINRENGIYIIYDNIFLNDHFLQNLVDILEDLYDNNEFTIFDLYFLIKPDFNHVLKFDVVNLNKHFSKFPAHILDKEITKVYKNTGLLSTCQIFVWFSNYSIENLRVIADSMKNNILKNINIINSTIHLDKKNTILNYSEKVKKDSEILLIINADFKTMDDDYKKMKKQFYNNNK